MGTYINKGNNGFRTRYRQSCLQASTATRMPDGMNPWIEMWHKDASFGELSHIGGILC